MSQYKSQFQPQQSQIAHDQDAELYELRQQQAGGETVSPFDSLSQVGVPLPRDGSGNSGNSARSGNTGNAGNVGSYGEPEYDYGHEESAQFAGGTLHSVNSASVSASLTPGALLEAAQAGATHAEETTKLEYRAYWTYSAALAAAGGVGRIAVLLLLDSIVRAFSYVELSTVPCNDGPPKSTPPPQPTGNGTNSTAPTTNSTMPTTNTTSPAASTVQASSFQCFLPLGGSYLNTNNVVAFFLTIALICTAASLLGLSPYGDFGHMRRNGIMVAGILGALSCMIMPAAYIPALYWLAALIIILMQVSLAISRVYLESYFPIFLRSDPIVILHRYNSQLAAQDGQDAKSATQSAVGGSSTVREVTENGLIIQKKVMKTMSYDERANYIQLYNNLYSFATIFIVFSLGAGILNYIGNNYSVLEGILSFVGVVWMGLLIFSMFGFKDRAGPDLPSDVNALVFPWRKTISTLKLSTKQLKNFNLYLGSLFLFGGSMGALGVLAIIFSQSALGLSNFEAFSIANLLPIFGILGSFVFYYSMVKFNISTHKILFGCIAAFTLIPIYGFAGAFNNSIGLVHPWEGYIISCYGGFFYGGAIMTSRALYAQFIPPGSESEFYGLFVFVDVVSTWFISLLASALGNWTNVRFGIFILFFFLAAALVLLWQVNASEGIHEAERFSAGLHHEFVMYDDEERPTSPASTVRSDSQTSRTQPGTVVSKQQYAGATSVAGPSTAKSTVGPMSMARNDSHGSARSVKSVAATRATGSASRPAGVESVRAPTAAITPRDSSARAGTVATTSRRQ